MAKKRAARVASRKVKDKWKSKQWYTIRAPGLFSEASLGETMADEPEKLKGRIAEATLQDVTGDFSKMHVKCYFKVRGTRGTDAVTTFDGHDLTSDYVRRLVRRSHSKIDDVVDVRTADGFKMRLKPMVVTERRAQATQLQLIRSRARDILERKSALNYNELVREVLDGTLSREIYDAGRLIMPLKRVEIRKSELVGEPEDAVEILDVFAPPPEPPEEEDEPVEDAGEEEAAETPSEEEGAGDEAEEEPEEGPAEASEGTTDEESAPAAEDAGEPEAEAEPSDELAEDVSRALEE